MHDKIKTAVGIEKANCETCLHLSNDCDGGEPEYSISWDICDEFPNYHNLKSFPFKTEMKCWRPDFWASSFPGFIKTGSHKEVMDALRLYNTAIFIATLDRDFRHMWE